MPELCTLSMQTLSSQACLPCAYVLASKDRQLLYNGPLRLLDNGKHSLDVVAFLFTDSILLTRQKNTQADKRGKKEVSRVGSAIEAS